MDRLMDGWIDKLIESENGYIGISYIGGGTGVGELITVNLPRPSLDCVDPHPTVS